MKIIVKEKQKKETFLALFQLLKGATSLVSMIIMEDHMFVQGMDKSHVCLFDMKVMKDWFNHFEIDEADAKNICFDSSTFHTILNIVRDDQDITLSYAGDTDKFNIDLTSSSQTNYDKYFSIPLTDLESDLFEIPETEYDVDFTINAKKICEITSQMILFGTDINIECSEEKVNLKTNGELGEMLVTIPIDDLNEYSIAEGEVIDLSYSLTFIHKMCLSTKLANDITISISKDIPMRITYDLDEGSRLLFYLAPKCNL